MAEDILDDPDKDFDDDMEDILEGSSPDDSTDSDSSDLYDLDADPLDENEEGRSKKNILARLTGKIPEKFKSKKVLMIIAVLIVLFFALVTGLIIFVFGGDSKQDQGLTVTDNQKIEKNVALEEEIVFKDIVALESFERIHLKTSSTMGLLSLKLSLELTDHRYRKQIIAMEDRIRQIVITQVAEMTWLELRNPEGKIRLKYDLLKRVNSLFPKVTVRNIFFTYFIMQ